MAGRMMRRVLGATRRIEGQPYDFSPTRRPPRLMTAGIAIGQTQGVITARSGTTPGSGLVVLQATTTASITPSSASVTAYNFSGQTIPNGKYVSVLMSNPPWIISAEC